MDQIHNSMLAMLQQTVMQQDNTPAKDAERNDDKSFHDLLASKRVPPEKVPSEKTAESESPVRDEASAMAEEPADMEEQLLAAALSAMQTPVVPVVMEQPEQETPIRAVPVAAQLSGLTETEAATQMDTSGKSVQPGVTESEAVDPIQLTQNNQAASGEPENSDAAGNQTENEADFRYVSEEVQEAPERQTAVFRNVKEIMVKVGEATSVGHGEGPEAPLSNQVSDQISKALERGEMRLSIRLDPVHLGHVDVQMTLTQNGTLHVEMRAENQMTRQLLEKEMPGLQHMLMRSTQQDVQIQITRQQESQHQAFDDGRQGGNHQNPQQERREERHRANDFLQQLRLGLIPLEAEAS